MESVYFSKKGWYKSARLHGGNGALNLKMKAACFFEMFVTIYKGPCHSSSG
jgi:hypothetical protein